MINKKFLYCIFFLSGFSGLIYELLWSHYLKMFLGHSAYAQSLVLCIFMGGMALGSYLSGFFSSKIKNTFLMYGVVEGIIGVFAITFHFIFTTIVNFSYEIVFSLINSSFWIIVYKVAISSFIIFPQTVLLGMTFPLMSSYFIRNEPEKVSQSVSILYFSNSIGAALGVFISGFYLVENFGMPATISIGGGLNLIIFFLVLFFREKTPKRFGTIESYPKILTTTNFIYILFLVAFGTGFSSFIYEIVWIRMLSLVLGSSTHNFEIMLCAFITGIAFGGLYIRLRASAIKNHIYYLAVVQILMGLSAIITLPLYNKSFEIISFLMNNLPKTELGYYLFNLSSQAISFVIMLPATFLAGMTFPLLSYIIFKHGYGEKAVGYTYAINTFGSILGVIFAVHVGFSLLGLKNLLFLGSAIDVFLGLLIVYTSQRESEPIFSPKLVATSSVSFVIAGFLFFNLDSYKLSSGVYREGIIFTPQDYHLSFYKDGKTASISVVGDGRYVSIRTNGKSDSAIALNEAVLPSADEYTASLAALIPYFYKPEAKSVAVIGLGTGLTSHVALLNPNPTQVDTVEIEQKVIEGAKFFISRNYKIFNDKRSKIYIDDAKTFFSTHRHKYDVIVSEPSNPWVSGVSALFSKEFYAIVNRHLNKGGVLVQWLQLYEIDLPHIASIMKAISNSFADYALYVTTENELLIVSSNETLSCLKDDIFKQHEIKKALERLMIKSVNDILLRKIGDKRHFDIFFKAFEIEENSDFYPVIERNSPKLRFFGIGAGELLTLSTGYLPVLELLVKSDEYIDNNVSPTPYFLKPYLINMANEVKEFILHGKTSTKLPPEMLTELNRFAAFLEQKNSISSHLERLTVMFKIFSLVIPNLPEDDVEQIISRIENSKNYSNFNYLETLWLKLYRAINKRDYKTMTIITLQLLEKDRGLPPVAEEYLMAVYLIGNIALEQTQEAKTFLQTSPKILELTENNIIFKYLVSYCR